MLFSEADRITRVIVCSPREEYYRLENLKAHNILEVADRKTAMAQHDQLKKLLADFGAEVIDPPELVDHPNSVFTRDASMVTPQGYIELRPGIESRLAEGRWLAGVLDELVVPRAGEIVAPGAVDGGDVVLFGKIAFVGLSHRTNWAGCDQLTKLLTPMGYQTRPVALPNRILHLDKVLMPFRPDKLLVCTDIVDKSVLEGVDHLPIEFGDTSNANIICLGAGEVIVGDDNQGALEGLADQGLTIHRLPISEFSKGVGGPNCLIMPVERVAA